MAIEVEADVFSGRTNPRWVLPQSGGEELMSRLSSLRPAESHAASAPGLGYRGFRIERTNSLHDTRWHGPYQVYGGFVQSPRQVFIDESRLLERWLLNSAGPGLPPQLREQIMLDIR